MLNCKSLYENTLLENVLPFWQENSVDREYGGYFSCLDRSGRVYDTDKFIWLQCREVWTFAMLYNKLEQREDWLELAIAGADFLKRHGCDSDGNWYFAVDRAGAPLIQPYNIFSDCFAVMAFGQLHKATDCKECREIAVQTFRNILRRKDNPKGLYEKAYPGTRPSKGLSLPMIISNLVLEIEHILDPAEVEETIQYCKDTIWNDFYEPDTGLLLETVDADGGFQDSFNGRLVIPGHSLESMWFLMDIAERSQDADLMRKAVDCSLRILDYGWDDEYGGIFYKMDIKGYPPDELEWDQKLWWVHNEAIVAVLKGYLHTGDERCRQWFERLHDYAWSHFSDEDYGEWFGYLNRRGEILLDLKGGKWKGCFHMPRFLFQSMLVLDKIALKGMSI